MSKAEDAVLKEARARWEQANTFDADNRREAMIDLRFRAGDQWAESDRLNRERDGRPCLTIDHTGQFVRKITGDIRLNPPGIKVRPVDGGSDTDLAETYTGLIRNIEAQSDAARVYAMAADAQVTCGLGWMRVDTDYCSDTVWELDLTIRLIPNPFAVLMDPAAVDPTRSDGAWCFVTALMPIEDFRKEFPDANLTDWDSASASVWEDWRQGDTIRICEYWRKVPTKKRLALLGDGKTVDITGKDAAALAHVAELGGGITRERLVDSHRVEMWLLNGVEVLDEVTQWAGKFIPIVPVLGEEVFVGDKVIRKGLVRPMRDAQMLYNLQRTALAESVGMAPKPKWLVTVAQIADLEPHWQNANTSTAAFLPYNPDPRPTVGPPARIAPDMPSAALLQELQLAKADMEATTGIYRENLGRETNAVSGRAILSRQREGDTGTYIYADNLAGAVAHVGRILVDLLPKIYDNQRQVRILGEDGGEKFVPLNSYVQDPKTLRWNKINDLSAGLFDVVSSTGPSFSTRQEEGREAFVSLMGANPELANLGSDIFAKMLNFPGADEFAQRARKMAVAKGLAEPEEGDPPPPPPQPDPNMVLAQAEQGKAQAAMQKAQTDAMTAQGDYQVAMAGAQNDAANTDIARARLALDQALAGAKVSQEADKIRIAAEQGAARLRIQAAQAAQGGERVRLEGERDTLAATFTTAKFVREMSAPPMLTYGQP